MSRQTALRTAALGLALSRAAPAGAPAEGALVRHAEAMAVARQGGPCVPRVCHNAAGESWDVP